MLRAITVVAVSLFCTACGQSSNSQGTTSSASVHVTPPDVQVTPTQASAVTASAAQPATPHSATPTRYSLPLAPDEWRAALAKAMRVSRVAEVDGKKPLPRYNTKYTFYDTKKTNLYAYGKYDGVVAYWLVPGARSNRVASEPYVGIEITVPNNNLPSLSLMPSYSSAKVDWLFLNHLAIISDGDAVVDRDLKDVRRAAEAELAVFTPTEDELGGLRSISKSSKVIVKLSGTNGEVTLAPGDANAFREEIIRALAIYDLLQRALRDKPV